MAAEATTPSSTSSSSSGSGSSYSFRVGVIGAANVGKTSIIQRARDESVPLAFQPTVGVEQIELTYTLAGNTVRLKVLDTSGSERFQAMTAQWVRNVDAYVLVYSLDMLSSAHDLTKWYDFILGADSKPKPITVVGNKCDLTSAEAPQIDQTRATAQAFVASHGDTSTAPGTSGSGSAGTSTGVDAKHVNARAAHIETSALSNTKIHHVFETVATRLIARALQNMRDNAKPVPKPNDTVTLSKENGDSDATKCAC